VLTEAGAQFVTPMALAALSENPVYTSLWDLKNEVEMGHIQLSREADLVVVCPATANLLAKMAAGIADDLATTLMLATDKPVMAIPAMNVRMWEHESTMRNVETLRLAGVDVMEPEEGDMACGEHGAGRLPELAAILQRIAWALDLNPDDFALAAPPPMVAELPQPEESVQPSEEVEAEPQPDAVEAEAEAEVAEAEPADENAEPGFDMAEVPDEEGADNPGTDIGGLSSSLISRGLKKAKQAISFSGFGPGDAAVQGEELTPPADMDSPILSKKGTARSAPPTDPDAINHLVSGVEEAAPQPFDEEAWLQGAGAEGQEAEAEDQAAEVEGNVEAVEEVAAEPPVAEVLPAEGPLTGRHVLVTAGPTWEPIDPVRYIANRSSGKQGFAIAAAAAAAGARVTLVAGPVHLATPPGVDRVDVETAVQMADAVKRAMPADIAVMVAAVADWRVASVASEKIKKRGSAPPALLLTENPDILTTVAAMSERPKLLIGFAAETEEVIKHAKDKRKRKGADWIIANDVSGDVMGGEDNAVHIVTGKEVESLEEMPKEDVARILVERFANALAK